MNCTPTDLKCQLNEFVDSAWDPELSLVEWRTRLLEAHWAAVHWPLEWYGRGLSRVEEQVVSEHLASLDIPGPPIGAGRRLAGPTLLQHGTDFQRSRLLPGMLTGRDQWCQLFSEPGSGSDLAGLTTRAERDGDSFRVTGQKLWSTSADHADFGLLLARTDWTQPKHHGITYFVLPMDQPGVEIRPLQQMNGHASFNEIFLEDVIVPADLVIGEVNSGWVVAKTTLANERRLADHRAAVESSQEGRARKEAAVEAREYAKTYSWYPQRAGRPDLAVDHARRRGLLGDRVTRQYLARLHVQERVASWTAERLRALGSQYGSVSKLASSEVAHLAAEVHSHIAGANGLLWERDGSIEALVSEVLLSVPAVSIAGGTDEIQRDIVAERVLGLPKEPNDAHQLPFSEVRRN